MRRDPQPRRARSRFPRLAQTAARGGASLLVAGLALLLGGLGPAGGALAGTGASALMAVAAAAEPGPALRVDLTADRHAISPQVYGMSFADPVLATEIGLPVDRWGGNHTDRYNWRIDTWNTGRDWFFENIAGCWAACNGAPPAERSREWERIVDGDRAIGAQTLLTLPMVGWVAKDVRYVHPLLCSFPRSEIADQDAFDVEWTEPGDDACGNGRRDGAWLRGQNDPDVASTPSTPQLSGDWIAAIRARYGAGAVRLYGLGNEPGLWDDTHVDVHPAPATYEEIAQKSVALATAVKDADPEARTLGFSEWGWPNYECSSADLDALPYRRCSPAGPDRAAHGGQPLATWFLDRMREASAAQGRRLLDYFDLHYYAQGGDSTEVTRSLWDPSYVDPSWIDEPIALLPRMRDWVSGHYPGTKLALTEYDLSLGADATTDTLIQADALSIFARERVDLAARWGPPTAEDPQANAFRLYRDYDGAGGRFGETWVRSESDDQTRVAVYGAVRGVDGALTVALVNKRGADVDLPLALSGADGLADAAQTWRWTPGAAAFARGADVTRGGDGSLALALPARSLTMVVVPVAGSGGPGGDPGGPGGDPGTGGPGGDPGTGDPGGAPGNGGDPGAGGSGRDGGSGGAHGGGAGHGGRPASLADRVGLPSARRCVRGRRIAFRIRSPSRRPVTSARVTAPGRRAVAVRGRALRRPVVVRGLPRRGSYTVRLALRTAGDRRPTVAQRRFRACR
jgi:hypothetical protein